MKEGYFTCNIMLCVKFHFRMRIIDDKIDINCISESFLRLKLLNEMRFKILFLKMKFNILIIIFCFACDMKDTSTGGSFLREHLCLQFIFQTPLRSPVLWGSKHGNL